MHATFAHRPAWMLARLFNTRRMVSARRECRARRQTAQQRQAPARQTYTLEINEAQRLLLVAAMAAITAGQAATNDDELDMLHDMLVELPQVESEHPGIVHGLCL